MGFLAGFLLGLVTFIGYVAWRALRSGHWDSSNLLNVLRALSFFATHPEVFPYLVHSQHCAVKVQWDHVDFVDPENYNRFRPFWYLPLDEFKDVVSTV